MKRQFKGIWIPADVWLNNSMSVIEKFLYAEILSFSSHDSSCYKANKTLSAQFLVSESTIKRAVKNLEQEGLIMITRTGRTRCMSALDLSCMGQPEPDAGQNEPDAGHIDLVEGSNRPPSKTVTRTASNSSKVSEVVMPFEEKVFKEAWMIWIAERKARRYGKYTEVGEAAALHKLWLESSATCEVAVKMIHESIANGWRGIFPLKEKNGRKSNGISKDFDRDKLQDYLESLGND